MMGSRRAWPITSISFSRPDVDMSYARFQVCFSFNPLFILASRRNRCKYMIYLRFGFSYSASFSDIPQFFSDALKESADFEFGFLLYRH